MNITDITPLERSFLTIFNSSLYKYGSGTIVDSWYVTFPTERDENVRCTKVSVFKGHHMLEEYRAYSVSSENRTFEVKKGETVLYNFADRIKRVSSQLSRHIENARKAADNIPNTFVLRTLCIYDILAYSVNKLSRIVNIEYELNWMKDRHKQIISLETVEVKNNKICHFFEKKEAFKDINEVNLDEEPTYIGLTIKDSELAYKLFMEMFTSFEKCDNVFLNL